MRDEQFFEDREDLTYLWCNELKGDKLVMSLAYFVPVDGQKYQRYDEEHVMHVYEVEKLVEILEEIGFSVKLYGEKLDKLNDDSKRVFFFCEKK